MWGCTRCIGLVSLALHGRARWTSSSLASRFLLGWACAPLLGLHSESASPNQPSAPPDEDRGFTMGTFSRYRRVFSDILEVSACVFWRPAMAACCALTGFATTAPRCSQAEPSLGTRQRRFMAAWEISARTTTHGECLPRLQDDPAPMELPLLPARYTISKRCPLRFRVTIPTFDVVFL